VSYRLVDDDDDDDDDALDGGDGDEEAGCTVVSAPAIHYRIYIKCI
jgi:hypothetical protein